MISCSILLILFSIQFLGDTVEDFAPIMNPGNVFGNYYPYSNYHPWQMFSPFSYNFGPSVRLIEAPVSNATEKISNQRVQEKSATPYGSSHHPYADHHHYHHAHHNAMNEYHSLLDKIDDLLHRYLGAVNTEMKESNVPPTDHHSVILPVPPSTAKAWHSLVEPHGDSKHLHHEHELSKNLPETLELKESYDNVVSDDERLLDDMIDMQELQEVFQKQPSRTTNQLVDQIEEVQKDQEQLTDDVEEMLHLDHEPTNRAKYGKVSKLLKKDEEELEHDFDAFYTGAEALEHDIDNSTSDQHKTVVNVVNELDKKLVTDLEKEMGDAKDAVDASGSNKRPIYLATGKMRSFSETAAYLKASANERACRARGNKCGECLATNECFFCSADNSCHAANDFFTTVLSGSICPLKHTYALHVCRLNLIATVLLWSFGIMFAVLILITMFVYLLIHSRRSSLAYDRIRNKQQELQQAAESDNEFP